MSLTKVQNKINKIKKNTSKALEIIFPGINFLGAGTGAWSDHRPFESIYQTKQTKKKKNIRTKQIKQGSLIVYIKMPTQVFFIPITINSSCHITYRPSFTRFR